MPSYRYRAYDGQGQLAQGMVDAVSQEHANDTLMSRGLTAFQLHPSEHIVKPWWQREVLFTTRSSRVEIAALTRELATLVGADIPLAEALRILCDQAGSSRVRALASSLLANVLNGAALSEAMQKQPMVFATDYVSIIRAGEVGGTLGRVFEELADLLERRLEIRAKIQSALVYPTILIGVGLVTLIIVVGVLVPGIASAFAESGRPLPPAAQFLVALKARWPEILMALAAGGVCAVWAIFAALRRPHLELMLDRYKLKMPLLGNVILHQETARFARTLGTLLRAGVPLLHAFATASAVISNRHIANGAHSANGLVREGVSLHRALEGESPFPVLALRMISIGEEAGRLDHMLLRVAAIFERQTQHSIDRFMTVLTPLLTVTMALVVGSLVLTMMSAMLSINDLAIQ